MRSLLWIALTGCVMLWSNPVTAQDGKPDADGDAAPAVEEKAAEEAKPAEEKPEAEVKEEPKAEEPAKEEPKPEQPAKEEPAKEEPKKEEPKPEEPKKEEPAKEEPKDEPKEGDMTKEDDKKDEAKPDEKEDPKKEDPKEEKPAEPKPELVVVDLETPAGVTVHEGTGHVFIAQRYGIYRYDPKEHQIAIEIAGYKTDVYGKGPKYNIGPLGVAFLDDSHLIVTDGSRPDGEELVRVYKVGSKAPDKWREEENADFTLGPIPKGEKTARGEGNFYAVTIAKGHLFVTNNGDDTKGWISSAKIEDGKPGKLELSIATKEKVEVDAPVAITTTPDGSQLAVGQSGEISKPGDSLLCFYDPESGELKASYETKLHDLVGLAYSPDGVLYGVDFAWADTKQGALHKIEIDGDAVKTTKVASLDKPTALAFDKEGNLYVTVVGTGKESDGERAPGQLLMFKKSDLK